MLHPTTASFNESFDIPDIVQALRDVRLTSLEQRHRRNKPPKLPSRKSLQEVVDGLSAALFPNRLGAPGLKEESVDYFVGYTLDAALRELNTQIQLELRYSADTEHDKTPSAEAAFNKARAFAKTLPQIRKLLDTDLDAAFEGDPAARSLDEVLVCYPGIWIQTWTLPLKATLLPAAWMKCWFAILAYPRLSITDWRMSCISWDCR